MMKLFTRDEFRNLRLYDSDFVEEDGIQPSSGELADIAVEAGELGTFDYALPQRWVADVHDKTGEWPFGLVWSYPAESVFWGEPFPLTTAARDLLARYDRARRGKPDPGHLPYDPDDDSTKTPERGYR